MCRERIYPFRELQISNIDIIIYNRIGTDKSVPYGITGIYYKR